MGKVKAVKLGGCSVIDYHNAKLAKKNRDGYTTKNDLKKTFGVTKNKNYYLLLIPQKAKFTTFFWIAFEAFFGPLFLKW